MATAKARAALAPHPPSAPPRAGAGFGSGEGWRPFASRVLYLSLARMQTSVAPTKPPATLSGWFDVARQPLPAAPVRHRRRTNKRLVPSIPNFNTTASPPRASRRFQAPSLASISKHFSALARRAAPREIPVMLARNAARPAATPDCGSSSAVLASNTGVLHRAPGTTGCPACRGVRAAGREPARPRRRSPVGLRHAHGILNCRARRRRTRRAVKLPPSGLLRRSLHPTGRARRESRRRRMIGQPSPVHVTGSRKVSRPVL